MIKQKYIVKTPRSTESLAEQIGTKLKGGEVIELSGDLGSGKTTFVRGLSRGVGSKDNVASPTFTISRVYKSSKLALHHLDFYRLSEPGIMSLELSELLKDKNSALVIEWAGVTEHVLPDNRLTISFKPTAENIREIIITGPEELKYLIPKVN